MKRIKKLWRHAGVRRGVIAAAIVLAGLAVYDFGWRAGANAVWAMNRTQQQIADHYGCNLDTMRI